MNLRTSLSSLTTTLLLAFALASPIAASPVPVAQEDNTESFPSELPIPYSLAKRIKCNSPEQINCCTGLTMIILARMNDERRERLELVKRIPPTIPRLGLLSGNLESASAHAVARESYLSFISHQLS
ncbi:hypothetical protein DFP72DRAFT_859018 [Ephemerocybe angulata]|uniref:Uncharacterized protein n=1 Tax=Ephemerocybe angulata TaxID=980116 RepID=A0A8H6LV54_9AGAR|nr:hypothetical protein DFP72DRAFT_859018 [Tulosesus angulatus]